MPKAISGAPVQHCGGYSVVGVTGPLSLTAFLISTIFSPFQHFMQDSRRCAVVNDLMITVRQVQKIADQMGRTVSVCAAADAAATRCSPTADWSRGWIAFVDLNGDGRMDHLEADAVLLRTVNGEAGVKVSATEAAFSFRPYYAPSAGTARGAGAFAVCDARGASSTREVVVSAHAAPRAQAPDARAPRCG